MKRPSLCFKMASAKTGYLMRKPSRPFDVQLFLESSGVSKRIVTFTTGQLIFSQGAPCESVFYLQKGRVKLSVLSGKGKEAVVAMLKPGDFFGEGCLAGQPLRIGRATAIAPTSVLVIQKRRMLQILRGEPAFSDRFIAHMLSRNIRIEQDLIDLLFNSSEKRLARALLLLARFGMDDTQRQIVPKISQETLSEIVGTTRSRVNFFMKKFKRLGFIDYNGGVSNGLHINSSLMSVVLHE
jgi:CRP/FNR family cyclic AMP-dependent transcriptional regulator